MPYSRESQSTDILARIGVSREGPPGAIAPLVALLVRLGAAALQEGPIPEGADAPQDLTKEDKPTPRLYEPEKGEMHNPRNEDRAKAARPTRHRKPSPKPE